MSRMAETTSHKKPVGRILDLYLPLLSHSAQLFLSEADHITSKGPVSTSLELKIYFDSESALSCNIPLVGEGSLLHIPCPVGRL